LRLRGREHVEPIDLVIERDLAFDAETIDEVVDGLRSVLRAVVDSLQVRHEVNVRTCSDKRARADPFAGDVP
jgi:hypothetical protein